MYDTPLRVPSIPDCMVMDHDVNGHQPLQVWLGEDSQRKQSTGIGEMPGASVANDMTYARVTIDTVDARGFIAGGGWVTQTGSARDRVQTEQGGETHPISMGSAEYSAVQDG